MTLAEERWQLFTLAVCDIRKVRKWRKDDETTQDHNRSVALPKC